MLSKVSHMFGVVTISGYQDSILTDIELGSLYFEVSNKSKGWGLPEFNPLEYICILELFTTSLEEGVKMGLLPFHQS